jgi:uncharacterized protein (TIGR03382 family)
MWDGWAQPTNTHTMRIPRLTLTSLILLPFAGSVSAALVSGSIAIIGYTDNGAPDSLRIAALTPLSAGEVIYFTDNGWTSGASFRGASATDGDGNETLIVLTINNPVAAGTVLSSPVNSGDWAWSVTGAVPGAASGTFANLALATGGDQIIAFQAPATLPLFNPLTMLYQMDNTGAFEDATTSGTGLLATGLTQGTTAVLLPTAPADFLSGTFGLNPADPDVSALQTSGGTQPQWLSVVSDPANWVETPGALTSLNVLPVPEPGTAALAGLAAAALLRRRRHQG